MSSLLLQSAVNAAKEGLLETLWPTRCIGCDTPGSLLCDKCASLLPRIDQRYACGRCGAPFGHLVCTECTCCTDTRDDVQDPEIDSSNKLSYVDGVCCYGEHEWPLDRIVRAYKDHGETRLSSMLAQFIYLALVASQREGKINLEAIDALCFVPATPKAYARRGFDHMEPVARELAVLLKTGYLDILARRSSHDQRSLGRTERSLNLRRSMVCTRGVAGYSMLCVDDVLTTGATMQEAARALKDAGAQKVYGATVVRVW